MASQVHASTAADHCCSSRSNTTSPRGEDSTFIRLAFRRAHKKQYSTLGGLPILVANAETMAERSTAAKEASVESFVRQLKQKLDDSEKARLPSAPAAEVEEGAAELSCSNLELATAANDDHIAAFVRQFESTNSGVYWRS